jgi:cytochrome c553
MFIRLRRPLQILCASLALTGAALAQDGPAGDAANGKLRSRAEQCQECHGEFGESTAEHYPRLGGQKACYLRKQLQDFQSGARKNEIMTAMASELSAQDIADIAAYFSGASRMAGQQSVNDPTGENLFENGDLSRGLPSCASCHADVSSATPVLAGQRELYLIAQLSSWKLDDRKNSPDNVMNAVAHALTEAEIAALARYLADSKAPG